jgi:hypothetical protein
MKIAIYRSRFKPWYDEEQEIPETYNLKDGETVSVKFKQHCNKPCEQDAPFGITSKEVCCDNC